MYSSTEPVHQMNRNKIVYWRGAMSSTEPGPEFSRSYWTTLLSNKFIEEYFLRKNFLEILNTEQAGRVVWMN